MAVQKLATLLGTTDDLKALVVKTRRLVEWQKRYADVAPTALAAASRVAGMRSGTLLLWADNAAVAAKLKQLTPRLMTALNKQANEVTSIRVQVQPKHGTSTEGKKRAKPGLPARAVERFAELSGAVSDTPLKEAIDALVEHHRDDSDVK